MCKYIVFCNHVFLVWFIGGKDWILVAVSGRISSHFAVQNHSTKPCSNAVQVMEVLETRHHQVLFGNQVTWLYGYFILPHRSNPWRPDHRPLLLELPVLAPQADITRDTTSTSTADSSVLVLVVSLVMSVKNLNTSEPSYRPWDSQYLWHCLLSWYLFIMTISTADV